MDREPLKTSELAQRDKGLAWIQAVGLFLGVLGLARPDSEDDVAKDATKLQKAVNSAKFGLFSARASPMLPPRNGHGEHDDQGNPGA